MLEPCKARSVYIIKLKRDFAEAWSVRAKLLNGWVSSWDNSTLVLECMWKRSRELVLGSFQSLFHWQYPLCLTFSNNHKNPHVSKLIYQGFEGMKVFKVFQKQGVPIFKGHVFLFVTKTKVFLRKTRWSYWVLI